jgi:hypothetical protein
LIGRTGDSSGIRTLAQIRKLGLAVQINIAD